MGCTLIKGTSKTKKIEPLKYRKHLKLSTIDYLANKHKKIQHFPNLKIIPEVEEETYT